MIDIRDLGKASSETKGPGQEPAENLSFPTHG